MQWQHGFAKHSEKLHMDRKAVKEETKTVRFNKTDHFFIDLMLQVHCYILQNANKSVHTSTACCLYTNYGSPCRLIKERPTDYGKVVLHKLTTYVQLQCSITKNK